MEKPKARSKIVVKRAAPPKLPKGYEPDYTTYELITKTTYNRPYNPPRRSKTSKTMSSKEYVQKVQVVNPKALNKGKRKRGR